MPVRRRGFRAVLAWRRPVLSAGPDRAFQGPAGVAWGARLEGWHLPVRGWPVFRWRALVAGLGVARWVLRHRGRAAAKGRPTGVGALRAGGARSATGRWGHRRAGRPGRRRTCPWARANPWLPWSWGCRPGLQVWRVRRRGWAGRSVARGWRLRHRFPARRRAGPAGWRWPGHSGDLAISRSRPRPRMGEPRRGPWVPASRAGRRPGSGSAPSRRRQLPARATRRDGPGKEARRDGPAGWARRGLRVPDPALGRRDSATLRR